MVESVKHDKKNTRVTWSLNRIFFTTINVNWDEDRIRINQTFGPPYYYGDIFNREILRVLLMENTPKNHLGCIYIYIYKNP